jgi:hypothetical protein
MPILPRSLWRALWWPAFWMAGGCHLPLLLTMTCEVSTAATGQCACGGACLSALGGAHVAATNGSLEIGVCCRCNSANQIKELAEPTWLSSIPVH